MFYNCLEKLVAKWGALNILYFIYIFFFFCPDYFQCVFIKCANYSLLIIAGIILYLNRYKPSKIAALAFCYLGVGVGLSFWHHIPNADIMLILRNLRQVMLVLFTDYMLQKNKSFVICTFFSVLVVWVGLALLSVFAFPKGLYVEYDANKWDKWVYSVNWLYGHKNNHALTFMIFQLFVWLAYEYKLVKLAKKYIFCLGILPLVASVIMRSVTTCVAMLCMTAALLIGCKLWPRSLPKLKLEYALAVFLGISLCYTVLSFDSVQALVGFDYSSYINLNGRNYMWKKVLSMVPEHLFLGIGLIDFAKGMELLGNKSFLHAHNTFLDILWKGGLLQLAFFFSLIYNVCTSIGRTFDIRVYNLLVLSFMALLSELVMESYIQEGKLFLLFLLLTFIAEDKQRG